MSRHLLGFAFALISPLFLSGAAVAQDLIPTDFLRGGFVKVSLFVSHEADDGTLTLGGAPVPGADLQTETTYGAAIEAGLRLGDYFAVAISGTTPMTTANYGAGSLTGIGNLGYGTVGYYALLAQARLPGNAIEPYVGGGLGYMHVFGTSDGVVSGLTVQPAFGGVVQAGIDIPVNETFGVFLDAKQFFITTDVTGTIGGLPAVARTRVDPWLITAGATVNF